MREYNRSIRRSLLLFCFWSTVVLISCATLYAKPLQPQTPGNEQPPGRGIRIIGVKPDGQAQRVGLQEMDMISKYGKFTVIDDSSFYKAREQYLKQPDKKLELEVWRGRRRLRVQVFPGLLGINTNEYNPVAYQFDSVMQRVDAMQQVPAFLREVEFKGQLDQQTINASLVEAKAIIDAAEAEGTLTAAQILVSRIHLILDDAPEEELKKQEVLLAEFVRTQPPEYMLQLGQTFMEKHHYRPARELFKHYLLTDPDNISIRLNFGYVSYHLGFWDDAEAAADLVLTHPEDLSSHGLLVAYQQKAVGALNRGDYHTCITFAEKAFAITPGSYEISLVQLAAASAGDIEKFNEVSARYKETLPKDYEDQKFQTDSAEALALAISGQDDLARAVIARWKDKDRIEGRLRSCWRNYPGGGKVAENWLRLAASQNAGQNPERDDHKR